VKKVHSFPEHGNSMIVVQLGVDPESIHGSMWNRIGGANKSLYMAHIILVAEDHQGFRLRIEKNRFADIETSSLYQDLKNDFPSLTPTEQYNMYNAGGSRVVHSKYLELADDLDAMHFKLKYC
jgi:hypothetical protein